MPAYPGKSLIHDKTLLGTVLAIRFRIRRPQSMGSLTRDRPGAELRIWCNLNTDFVEVVNDTTRGNKTILDSILSRFGPNLIQTSPSAAATTTVLVSCPADRVTGVTATIERLGGIVQPPIVSRDGWDEYRLIQFNDGAAPELLAALAKAGTFELVSKKPLKASPSRGFFVASDELLAGLTRRQAEALVAAAKAGYYEEPRATNLSRVATTLGLGRTSLEEHLRKAENKILTSLLPFVSAQAVSLPAATPRGRPFARNNRHQAQGGTRPRPLRAKRRHT